MQQDIYNLEYQQKHKLPSLDENYLKISDIRKIKTDHTGLGFIEYGSTLYMDQEDQIEQKFNSIMKSLFRRSEEAHQSEDLPGNRKSNRIGFAQFGDESESEICKEISNNCGGNYERYVDNCEHFENYTLTHPNFLFTLPIYTLLLFYRRFPSSYLLFPLYLLHLLLSS